MATKICKDKKSIIYIILTVIILLFAALLFFSRLDYNTSLVNDEHQSFSVALNVMDGNGLVRSDFVQNMNQPMTYQRGWPSTYLLAGWMHIFGVSEVSARSLSAVYGILFLLSLLYISYRISNEYTLSLLSASLVLGYFEIIQHFRIVRMYSLELVISIWLYYFIFKFLLGNNRFYKKKDNTKKWVLLVGETLNYDWIYFPLIVILTVVCFGNFVNGVILWGGVALFIVVQSFVTKEKKYVFLTAFGFAVFAVFLVNIIFYNLSGKFIFASRVFSKFLYYSGFSVQPEYLKSILSSSGHYLVGLGMVVILVITSFFRKPTSALIYIGCLNIFTLFFYCFFSAGRYSFRARYILDLVPWAIMLFAYAFTNLRKLLPKLSWLVCGVLVAGVLIHYVHFIQLYAINENKENSDFITAYGKTSEYYNLEEDNIPIVESYLRAWYANKVFKNPNYSIMTRSTAFSDWYEFAENNPQGIITCEEIKTDKLGQDVEKIVYRWTDRISGKGVDNTGVNVSHYCFISAEETDSCSGFDAKLCDDGFDVILGRDEINTVFSETDDAKVIFVRTVIDSADGKKDRFFGLLLPDESKDAKGLLYHISQEELINIPVNSIDGVAVDDTVAVYFENKLKEGVTLK